MNITLFDGAVEIRKRFISRFILSWDDFKIERKDFIDEMTNRGHIVDIDFYNQSHLWDLMPSSYSQVSFRDALSALSSIDGDVVFMSENESHEGAALLIGEKDIVGFVAKTTAVELARLIEKEWFEGYELAERGMFNPNPILPEDLYVFDEKSNWFIAFTHEITDLDSQLNNPMKSAESRLCVMHFPTT